MHPILFKIGPVNIFSYGVMIALGFACAIYLIGRRSNEYGIKKELIIDFAIFVLLAGIAGGRILYVVINLRFYAAHPLEIFNLSKGGLVWHGAFLSGVSAGILFVRKNKMDFWQAADLIAPYIALGQAFGRIGCFLNGCCYGISTREGAVFPVQLLASFALVIIFIVLRLLQSRPHFKGGIFIAYCVIYSLKRFLIEFLRGDVPRLALGLTLAQWISIFIFVTAACVYAYRRRFKR